MISDDTTPTAMAVARDIIRGKGNAPGLPPPLRGTALPGEPAAVPPELIAALIIALIQTLQGCFANAQRGYVYLTEKDFGRWDWLPWNRREAKREQAIRRALAAVYPGNQDDLPVLYCQLMGYVDNVAGPRDVWLLYDEARRTPSLSWIDKDAFMRD